MRDELRTALLSRPTASSTATGGTRRPPPRRGGRKRTTVSRRRSTSTIATVRRGRRCSTPRGNRPHRLAAAAGARPADEAKQKAATPSTSSRTRRSWHPEWPDPFLGLARLRLRAARPEAARGLPHELERRGYPRGRREKAMLADGYHAQAEQLLAQSGRREGPTRRPSSWSRPATPSPRRSASTARPATSPTPGPTWPPPRKSCAASWAGWKNWESGEALTAKPLSQPPSLPPRAERGERHPMAVTRSTAADRRQQETRRAPRARASPCRGSPAPRPPRRNLEALLLAAAALVVLLGLALAYLAMASRFARWTPKLASGEMVNLNDLRNADQLPPRSTSSPARPSARSPPRRSGSGRTRGTCPTSARSSASASPPPRSRGTAG